MTLLWNLAKRAADPAPATPAISIQFRSGSGIIFFLDALLLIPIFIFVHYTMSYVYVVLAIIENEKPPTYAAIAIDDNAPPHNAPPHNDDDDEDPLEPSRNHPRAITTSLRSTHNLLRSHGGFCANFRGLSCSIALLLCLSLSTLLTPSLPFAIAGSLVANLVLAPLSTALVHIVITPASPLRFWNRIPSFNRTVGATWKPILLNWSAIQTYRLAIYLASLLLGMNSKTDSSLSWLPNLFVTGSLSGKDAVNMLKCLALLLLTVLMVFFAVLPAHVILVRVQASLLPPDQDTIIPFDRSFNGRVEPAVVKGHGFATISDAWATFSRAAWTRLILLQVKIVFTSFLSTVLAVAFVAPQIYFLIKPVRD